MAQQQPENGDAIFRENVRVVMAPVTVTTKDGSVVNNLKPTDFQLLDNNKPQRFTEDVTAHPLSVVVAVQANSQVEKILPQVQKIGSLLQAQVLGDEGEAAVMMFDHRIQTLQDFTSDGDKINVALKKLKPGSSSARLNDATIEAITMLKTRPASRRRALLLLSESRDQGSELRAREVLSAAEFANVVIYSVNMSHLLASLTAAPPAGRTVLDNRPPGAVHLPAGQVETETTRSQTAMGDWSPVIKEIYIAAKAVFVKNPLEVYTTYSGGREYNFKTQRDLDRAISDLGEELHSQYLLTYTPNNQDEPGYHNIVVKVNKPDMKVRTRDGYYLAGTPDGAKK
ncbi:MAG: VWA domain-containing protein [Bryobacteraceae bacterium]